MICREKLALYLANVPHTRSVYVQQPTYNNLQPSSIKAAKRKVNEIDDDVDDVYDAIKRLYADEETVAVTKSATAADTSVASSTCAGELQLQIRAANALAMHQTVAVK